MRDALAAHREHDLADDALYFISWEALPDKEKQPFRTAVDECMEAVIQVYDQ